MGLEHIVHCGSGIYWSNKVIILNKMAILRNYAKLIVKRKSIHQLNAIHYLFYFSLIHSLYDNEMFQSASSAHHIEQVTEHPWQFIVLLTALTSEPINDNDYFSLQTFTGKSFRINQST